MAETSIQVNVEPWLAVYMSNLLAAIADGKKKTEDIAEADRQAMRKLAELLDV
jgi:hypothetical protein